jgi:plasmid stability protein
MATLTVRNLPAEVHRALRIRAAEQGRSTEAEIREILTTAVQPNDRVKVGDALADIGRQVGFSNDDFKIFDRISDKTLAKPLTFD